MRYFMLVAVLLTGCQNTILKGATHACGTLHIEGYFTDSQGDVIVVKAPTDWTPEQVMAFCEGR